VENGYAFFPLDLRVLLTGVSATTPGSEQLLLGHGNTALDLLKELPDPEQELFCSEPPGFPRLPIELRLRIWRSTFPRTRCILAFTKRVHKNVRFPEPITAAWINQESRLETLRYYQLMERSNSFEENQYQVKVYGPVNFMLSRNNKENVIQIQDEHTPGSRLYGDFLDDYLGSGDLSWPFFSGIATLEVDMYNFFPGFFYPHHWMRVLRWLSVIRLVDRTHKHPRSNGPALRESEEEAQDSLTMIKRAYQFRRHPPPYTIPEVILYGPPGSNHALFLQWQEEQAMAALEKGYEADCDME
jgi:hypothetical protein